MKGGNRGLTSPEPDEQELDREIREAAASFVNDVIFRAKEMTAQRSYQVQQAFSIVEEEDEEAVLAEEMANRFPARSRENSFSGPTPEIQIDLVGDRTPSPEETPTYVAPPSKPRQVKIRHRVSTSSLEGSDDFSDCRDITGIGQEIDHNNVTNSIDDSNRSDIADSSQHDHDNQVLQENPQRKEKDNHVHSSSIIKSDTTTSSICHHRSPRAVIEEQHPISAKDVIVVGAAAKDATAPPAVEESPQRKGAKEYMCSKPASLPFADDSPPGLGPALESPSEALVAERVATTKSPLPNEAKGANLKHNSDLRHFVEEYIKGITEQAQLLADERARKSIPHAKYHSPTDGPRASVAVVLTMKSSEGPWYSRLRSALTRCLQSSCFCVNLGRHPEAV